MAGGLFVLPKMHKITQNSLLKKHGIFCLTFSSREVSDIPLDSREGNYYNRIAFIIGVWRSLVSRLVRVQEAPGSNPGTPTIGESLWDSPIFYLYFSFPNSYNYCCMEMCNFL